MSSTRDLPKRAASVASDPHTAGFNGVIDLSHNNGTLSVDDFKAAREGGIRAVFHKATQGLRFADPRFAQHLAAARQAGLLVGAYHFGTADDAGDQFAFFADTVGKAGLGPIPLVLDYEPNTPPSKSMSLEGARNFLQKARERFGKPIGLYSGATVREALGAHADPLFAECWLWLPSYGTQPTVQTSWDRWTFWQYTDGSVGPEPRRIPGFRLAVDRSTFGGTEADLTAFWSRASVDPAKPKAAASPQQQS